MSLRIPPDPYWRSTYHGLLIPKRNGRRIHVATRTNTLGRKRRRIIGALPVLQAQKQHIS